MDVLKVIHYNYFLSATAYETICELGSEYSCNYTTKVLLRCKIQSKNDVGVQSLRKKYVYDSFQTVREAVRQGRSRISFLVQICQLSNVHVSFQAKDTGKIEKIMCDTVSVSSDSG